MRLLYSFPDRLGAAGIGNIAYHQVVGAIENGAEVLVYCTSTDVEVPGASGIVETLTLGGRRVPHRVLGVGRSYRVHDERVARALKKAGSDVDIVHTWPRATTATATVARSAGIPTMREVPNCHTAHAYAVVGRENERLDLVPEASHSHAYSAAILAGEETEYEGVDYLLVPSDFVRDTFLERGFRSDKLLVHRFGYDPAKFFPTAADDRFRDPFTALFVGRCEPRKGLHLALRAWLDSGAADRGRFVICGSFVPGYREALEGLLAHPSVEIHGFIPNPATVMREADVFVLPSLEEGSAVVSYEAQACGCVLVVSTAVGARCTHMEHGLIHEPRDVVALTDHLRMLRENRQLLNRLRASSLARIDELSWAAAARELDALYRAHSTGRRETLT